MTAIVIPLPAKRHGEKNVPIQSSSAGRLPADLPPEPETAETAWQQTLDTSATVISLRAFRQQQDTPSHEITRETAQYLIQTLTFALDKLEKIPATIEAHHRLTWITKDTIDRLRRV